MTSKELNYSPKREYNNRAMNVTSLYLNLKEIANALKLGCNKNDLLILSAFQRVRRNLVKERGGNHALISQ